MTTPSGEPAVSDRFEDRFVTYVRRICGDPGTRAGLRRAARRRPEQAISAHRFLAAWIPENSNRHREAVLYQVAAWVAQFDSEAGDRSRPVFGKALAAATGRISRNSIESRLMAAGRATADLLLYQHLPQILGQLHSTGTVPDFAALTRDLFRWPYASGEVIKRWMTDFYRAVDAPKTPAAETPSPSATAVAH